MLKQLAEEYELSVDPDAQVEDLSVGHQQRVEILKALYRQADILILDEPTGVLTPAEADHLFRILDNLRAEGKTIILITHKLREIMEITDTVSRDAPRRDDGDREDRRDAPEELAELMVGRKVLLRVDKAPAKPKEALLEIENLPSRRRPGRREAARHLARGARGRDRRHRGRRGQRAVRTAERARAAMPTRPEPCG